MGIDASLYYFLPNVSLPHPSSLSTNYIRPKLDPYLYADTEYKKEKGLRKGFTIWSSRTRLRSIHFSTLGSAIESPTLFLLVFCQFPYTRTMKNPILDTERIFCFMTLPSTTTVSNSYIFFLRTYLFPVSSKTSDSFSLVENGVFDTFSQPVWYSVVAVNDQYS